MHGSPEQQWVLECGCGETTVIIGSEDDWRARRPVFRCECGQKLTLDGGRTDEGALAAS